MNFDGQTAIVTGGAQGIGRAIAREFADLGANVVIGDIDSEKAAETIDDFPDSGRHLSTVTDVTREGQVEEMVNQVRREYGTIDILVNNAGAVETVKETTMKTGEEWDRIVEGNLKGAFLCSKLFAPALQENGDGRIINISSVAGLRPLTYRVGYGAAKSGINMLTQALALEWGPEGIRVNAVAPGHTWTEKREELTAEGKRDSQPLIDRTPLGRMAQPDEIGDAVVFLASDRAKFITGVVLPVDGGWVVNGDVDRRL